ncbi:MAG: Uma2 family endonuclease [Defluviitaleaceae bacterium]|nr:Uma2 family endonuclease [Defluviitaleaceae bacterium]
MSAAEQFQAHRYTYNDYVTWDDDVRWELIDGVPYAMAAPTLTHQGISGNLFALLHGFLRGKPCRVYSAPIDVRLNYNNGDNTVVQPDIIVVCDPNKRHESGCLGAPDLVIEVLSPSTARTDRVKKFNKYLEAGVNEYWIVEPDIYSVQVHLLKDGTYTTRMYEETDTISVSVLPGCEIGLAEVFN